MSSLIKKNYHIYHPLSSSHPTKHLQKLFFIYSHQKVSCFHILWRISFKKMKLAGRVCAWCLNFGNFVFYVYTSKYTRSALNPTKTYVVVKGFDQQASRSKVHSFVLNLSCAGRKISATITLSWSALIFFSKKRGADSIRAGKGTKSWPFISRVGGSQHVGCFFFRNGHQLGQSPAHRNYHELLFF